MDQSRDMLSWDEICADSRLGDLPFKIETNEYGQIVMSPAKFWHSSMQGKLTGLLWQCRTTGDVSTETAIATSKGVKVADVAWASEAFIEIHGQDEPELKAAPELCVEIVSDSNTQAELLEKRLLYFAHGAKEVWECSKQGDLAFYKDPLTKIKASRLFPNFPTQI